jgi:hypothetical protein
MAARIIFWLAFLALGALCLSLISLSGELARRNIALQAALDGPHDSKVEAWAAKDGSVFVVVDGRFGHVYPLMCTKLGFKSL